MKAILDKGFFIPAFAVCAMLTTMLIAGCNAAYAGGGVLQIQQGCHVRQQVVVQPVYAQQFVAPVYQQQFVQPQRVIVRQQFVQPHRQQVVVQQLNNHHQQAVVVQRVQVQRPQRQQVIRQRSVTRIR